MNELKVFENPEFGTVRTVVIDGEPWFVAKDIAQALGYSKTDSATRLVDDDDKKNISSSDLGEQGYKQSYTIGIINESGMYALIFGSKLKDARKFKHWVTSAVLPKIRRTGEYKAEQSELTPAQVVANALIVAQEIIAEKDKQIKQLTPKAGYFDAFVDSKLLTNFRDTAKELGYSQKELVGWLLTKGYIYKDSKGIIKPYEQYRKQGLFAMKDFQNPNSGFTGTRTLVTVKGKNTFRLLMQVPDDTIDVDWVEK